jgi:ribosome-binding factor A
MDSLRQQRVAKQIQKEIGELFQREGRDIWGGGALVTVTGVRITKDLQIARVYLSVFGAPDKQAMIEKIREKGNEIRYQLGRAMRHQLRVIPTLEFYEDDSLDYIENIDRLLNE